MKSSLMKMVSGAFAALCAGGLFADTFDWDNGIIYQECDLATVDYSQFVPSSYQVRCGQGATRTYTLGADLDKNIVVWRNYTEWWYPDHGSTAIFDFSGGHTYYVPGSLEIYSSVENTTHSMKDGEDPRECAQAKMYVRNATIDGKGSASMYFGRQSTSQSYTNGLIQVENSTITNMGTVFIGDNMADAEINFKNSMIAGVNMRFCEYNYFADEDLKVTFENTKVSMTGGVLFEPATHSDSVSFDDDVNHRYVFKGAGTVAHFAGSIEAARGIPYGQILVDDGAQLITDRGLYFGNNLSTARGWTVTVQSNAVLQTGWGFYFGWNSGNHTLIIRDGGALKQTLNVGRYSDNNTLIVSNGNMTGCSGITVGGCSDNPQGAPSGNKAFFYGQNTTFSAGPFNDHFFKGKNGLLYLNDVTVNNSEWSTYKLSPINPNQEDVDDAWSNNTLFLDNGTQFYVYDFLFGAERADSEAANNQHLIVGNNSLLNVKSQFMNSGTDNSITISNGTIRAGSQWGFYVGYFVQGQTPHSVGNNTLIFQGNHPRVQKQSETAYGEGCVSTDTTVRYDLPDDGNYQQIPFEFDRIAIGDGVKLEFTNLAKVRQTIASPMNIPLMRGDMETYGEEKAGMAISQTVIDNANAKLEEQGFSGCKVHVVRDEGYTRQGTVYLHVVPEGLSYDAAFKSIQAYNDAVTNEAMASIYAGKDTYLVLSNMTFDAGSKHDYSLAKQTKSDSNPKLHLFVYNCTFPEASVVADGTMDSDNGDVVDTTRATNRKMIALSTAKELWVEGCTFNSYQGDSYVIDLNLYNTFANEGCGITIKGNKFLSGAGKRVPISVKNKENLPPAFVLIEGNEFSGCAHDISDTKDVTENDTYAGVICFGDQSTSTTTAGGANFPITIQNNTFADGVTQYVVMSGMYVSSGKQGLDVPVGTSYTWAKNGDSWVSTPAFPTYSGDVSYDVKDDGSCTIKGKGELTASLIETIGKSNLKSVTLGPDFTSVEAGAFEKCYNLQSVTFSSTSAVTLADYAFYRCFSLTEMNFAAMPNLGVNSITMQAAIYMKDGLPSVYPIPTITVSGYHTELVGTNELNGNDTVWTVVDPTDATARGSYHFFKLQLVADSQD